MNSSIFYNYDKLLSYNALLNLIVGERGVGKTYGAKKYVINRYKKHKKQFVYLRRYDSDLEASVGNNNNNKFFEQVKKEFPDDSFTISKNKKVRKLMMNGEVIGYALPLSNADSLKSSTYEGVDTIIYDEFMIKPGSPQRYLSNEPEVILDLIETIGRLRDIKVICLANAVSSTCPLMSYFDLSLPYGNEYKLFKNGLICVNYIKNYKYREVKKQTRFGQLIEGTPYGKYAIDNEFMNESKVFVQRKNGNCHYFFTLVLNLHKYGVWIDFKNDNVYMSDDIDDMCPTKLALFIEDHAEMTILVKARTNPYFQVLVNHYRASKLFFENQRLKNILMNELYKYLN